MPTDQDNSANRATVHVVWSESLTRSSEALPALYRMESTEHLALVPSSLTTSDAHAKAVRAAFREHHVRPGIVVPRSVLAVAASPFQRLSDSAWFPVSIGESQFRLDARIVAARYIAVVSIDTASRRGPFVLDLPSRFLHPTDRIRLLSRRDRQRLLADVAACAQPSLASIATPCGTGMLTLITADTIAAELCAITVAERFHDERLETQGPWEDPTIQRATELELGVRIPNHISFVYECEGNIPAEAWIVLRYLAQRLGITFPSRHWDDT